MRARAVVALTPTTLTPAEIAAGGLDRLERGTFEGEGATWEAAKEAAGVPAGGVVMYWMKDE